MSTKMNKDQINELLQRTTFTKLLPAYTEVDGYQLGYRYNEIADEVENLEVRDSDVWVCSFPKTGTTWTQEMVWLLMNNLDYEGAEKGLHVRFPFLEFESMFHSHTYEKVLGRKPEYEIGNSLEFVKNMKSNPRFIKSHLAFNLLPKAIRTKEKRPKIVYVTRNPKDTCVSFYHHHKLLHGYKGNFEEFASLFLQDQIIWTPYWRHVESYWKQQNEPNVLFIKYEDMKRDLSSVIAKLCAFLNVTAPQGETLNALIKHLSFNTMKNNESVNLAKVVRREGNFVRKGIIGDHKNEMSPEIEAEFDKWIEENNKIGITF